MYTFSELLKLRMHVLRVFKADLRNEVKDREERFRRFKQLCRDRKFDAIAGTCETPEGVYYFPWEH